MIQHDERREWTIKWDREYQYTDGVPAEVMCARGDELGDHERVKVREVLPGSLLMTAPEIRRAWEKVMKMETSDGDLIVLTDLLRELFPEGSERGNE